MDASPRHFELTALPELFAIVRLPAIASVPSWATMGTFHSVTRTPDELSIVCAASNVPRTFAVDERWRVLKVHGPFPLSEVGVLAQLAAPLAVAEISVFVISTFDTDYLLVSAGQLHQAIDTLKTAGHKVHEAPSASQCLEIARNE